SSWSARSSSRDAVSMGSSSPGGRAVAVTGFSSGVVINGDLGGLPQRLAGEDVAGFDLGRLEGVVAPHRRGAVGDPGPAGAADAALAGKRQIGPDPLGAVQDRGARGQGEGGAAGVE